MSPEATMGDTVADQLRALGTRGVPRSDGATWTDHRAPLRDADVLLPQGARVFRPEIDSPDRLGAVAGSLPPAQGRRWTPRPLERPAFSRALQQDGLRLA